MNRRIESIQRRERRLRWDEMLRRALDVTIGSGMLLALSPFLALVCIGIRLDSRGPLLFSQSRVGKHGRLFRLYKFRSMCIGAEAAKRQLAAQNESADGVTFKIRQDPRITRVGRFIRRYSIDELPQLWNVVRGDMSLVGPRPAVPGEVAQYSPSDCRRLRVKPGLTCFWQVEGRSEIPFNGQVELDTRYIGLRNLVTDLKLLIRTIPAVLSGRGAY
jgi:lipopolysaccharide/colanic/teichoic acid biosynthesis glycosyltransferase